MLTGIHLLLHSVQSINPLLGALEHLHLDQRRGRCRSLSQEAVHLAAKLAGFDEQLGRCSVELLDFFWLVPQLQFQQMLQPALGFPQTIVGSVELRVAVMSDLLFRIRTPVRAVRVSLAGALEEFGL